ncbi:MAG: YceI family protein [Gaiellaceae bacterium]
MSTTETSTFAPAGTWRLDPVHSTVGFEIAYLAGTFKGEFREVQSTLEIADDGASLSGTAQVASVDVKDENLAAHLQSPDFFDAERHPELRFTAGRIALDGDTVSVDGEITLKGVTKPVTVTGTASPTLSDPYGNERVGFALGTTVDRTDFGIDWNMPLPSGGPALANDVTIVAELQFVKAD